MDLKKQQPVDFQLDPKRSDGDVAEVLSWCTTIALHQKYGIGRQRLERLAAYILDEQQRHIADILNSNRLEAEKKLRARAAKLCTPEIMLPLTRAPKGNSAQRRRAAADAGASKAWQMYALAVRTSLGFGRERLETLRREVLANYAQFNGWYNEDKDWAIDNLRKCVEAAMQEECTVVEDDNPALLKLAGDLQLEEHRAVKTAVVVQIARNQRPAGFAALNQDKLLRDAQAAAGVQSVRPKIQLRGKEAPAWQR